MAFDAASKKWWEQGLILVSVTFFGLALGQMGFSSRTNWLISIVAAGIAFRSDLRPFVWDWRARYPRFYSVFVVILCAAVGLAVWPRDDREERTESTSDQPRAEAPAQKLSTGAPAAASTPTVTTPQPTVTTPSPVPDNSKPVAPAKKVQIRTGRSGAFYEIRVLERTGAEVQTIYRIALDNPGDELPRVALILEDVTLGDTQSSVIEFRPDRPLKPMLAATDAEGRFTVPARSLAFVDVVTIMMKIGAAPPDPITDPSPPRRFFETRAAYVDPTETLPFEYLRGDTPYSYDLYLRLETSRFPPQRFRLRLSARKERDGERNTGPTAPMLTLLR